MFINVKMMNHQFFMQKCFTLAFRGAGFVSPNPMVGAILVHDTRIIGEGFHEKYGEAHAEVNCISSVRQEDKHLISGAILYVSLEPCSHFGKTPPCVNFIIQHEIKKVVVACHDTSSKVNGKGIVFLRSHGVEVIVGILEKEALEVNKRFFISQQKKRPYIVLKYAQSKDGFIGNYEKQIKLTNHQTDTLVHQWRSDEDAVWVGFRTVLVDNPMLNVRLINGVQPKRIVYDRNMELQSDLNILNNQQDTIIFNHMLSQKEGRIYWRKIILNDDFNEMIAILFQMNVTSILVEGGSSLLEKLIRFNLWDEARIITVQKELNEGVLSPKYTFTNLFEEYFVDEDKIQIYKNTNLHE
jgi:diaminohydroxyphosphoribosylaminopyrimidine deaminase / 5-amino-6-(5-phosphoribosylamino)uracil reductase